MQQLAAGKDVALHEVAEAGAELMVAGAAGGDAVVQQQPARLEQAVDLGEVGRQLGPADMLEHAHRGDLVERLVVRKAAVVEQVHPYPPGQAALLDDLVDVGVLVAAEGDAARLHAVVLGRVQQEAAPAGADVEEALAFLQHQLAADVLQLGFLRRGQVHAGVAVIGAGIDPLRVEPEGVEVVGDVVVELDLLGVDLGPVPRLGARQVDELLQPADRRRHRHHVDLGRIAGHQLGGQRHHVAHAAVDVDAALDVVLADLADPPGHQVGDGREVVHPHGDGGILRADASASGQHHRQRRGQALQSLFEGGGSGNRRHGPFLRRPEFTKARGPPRDAEPYVRGGRIRPFPEAEDPADRHAVAALRRGRTLDQPARTQAEPVGGLEQGLGVDLGQPDHVVARLGDLQPHPVEHLVVGAQQQHLVGQVPEGGEAPVEVADVAGEIDHQDAVADRFERRLQLRLDDVGAAPASNSALRSSSART